MDEPIPGSWWYHDSETEYISVVHTIANFLIGKIVSIKKYSESGVEKPADGMSLSRWDAKVKTGDLKLLASPPWVQPKELTLDGGILSIEPTGPVCTKCVGTKFKLYPGPVPKEHRWLCLGCWATFDEKTFEEIGGNVESGVK